MPTVWIPCGACERHIKSTESACPFCGASPSVSDGALARARERMPRLHRAAIVALGTTLAGAAAMTPAGCSSNTVGGSDASAEGGPDDDGGNAALYGVPAIDSGADAASDGGKDAASDAPSDAPFDGIAPAYGLPPISQL